MYKRGAAGGIDRYGPGRPTLRSLRVQRSPTVESRIGPKGVSD